MITAECLRSILVYDESSGQFNWRVDRGQRFKAGDVAGHTSQFHGYRVICIEGRYYKAHRLAWLYVYGSMPVGDLDHINHEKADNRICNLRECSAAQNQANRGSNKNNTTGYRGVSFHKRLGKYQAAIRVNRKPIHLGSFDTAADAGAAYEAAARKHYGDFANTAMLTPSPVTVDAMKLSDHAREIVR